MSTNHSKRSSFPADLKLMSQNLSEVMPAGVSSLMINGESQSVSTIEGTFLTASALDDKIAAEAEALKEDRVARQAGLPAVRALFLQVAAYLRLTLGPTSAALATVGVATQQPKARPTNQTRAAADAKRKATVAAGGAKKVKQQATQTAAESASAPTVASTAAPVVTK